MARPSVLAQIRKYGLSPVAGFQRVTFAVTGPPSVLCRGVDHNDSQCC